MAKFSEYRTSFIRLVSLYIANTKLKTTEIAVRLLSAILIGAIALILIAIIVIFLSMSGAYCLAQYMGPVYAFLIVGGFYIALLAFVWFCRTAVVINPLSRILSHIILSNPIQLHTIQQNNDIQTVKPNDDDHNDETAPRQ